jgi:crotonobetainyl-CoA:carnitine CoA-transferase CaiB-like acyl-CoA transferase
MGIIQHGVHAVHGPVRYVRTPLSVDGTPVVAKSLAPRLGAHSLEVLKELTDLSDDEISQLHDDGVIGLGQYEAGISRH